MHEIHAVTAFAKRDDFVLEVAFEDGARQLIDFRPVLEGELFGPPADPRAFDRVRRDPEAHTLAWPNGADFDPDTLYHWPTRGPKLAALAATWQLAPA